MNSIATPTFLAPERPPLFPQSRGKGKRRILVISATAHGILLMLLSLSVSSPDPVTRKSPPISAVLYTPPPKQEEKVADLPPASEAVPTDESMTSLPRPTAIQPAQPETVELVPEPVTKPTQPDTTPHTKADRQPESAGKRLSVSGKAATSAYFEQQQATQLNDIAKEAAAERRRLNTSPQLIDNRKGQEEEAPAPPEKKINCSKGVNKTLAVLSGFAGGTLVCSERQSNIDEFIDKHKK